MTDLPTLIIDDEKRLSRSLELALSQDGYQVTSAHTAQDGINEAIRIRPRLILLDLRLPDADGLEPLTRLKAELPDTTIIMMSAHGDIRVAVDAVKAGATDFITKPFDINELKSLVRHSLMQVDRQSGASKSMQRQPLIGDSPVMQILQNNINRIAGSSARTILLQGPSGTGKTAVAREIHALSQLADQPFMEVNCAALPESLLEAELFGAEKGAYTGAHKRRRGLIEVADGGVLFLDEIGELSLPIQAKLLTFLESHSYRSIGSNEIKYAQMRVVAATNRLLNEEVEAGNFRADLFYRLNVMPLDIPALAEREGDIPVLLNHFSQLIASTEGCDAVQFSDEVRQCLNNYPWPGNVRELKNLVERLTILYPGATVTLSHLPQEVVSAAHQADSLGTGGHDISEKLALTERDLILKALADCSGHKGRAAEKLNLSRHALKRRLQKLGIQ